MNYKIGCMDFGFDCDFVAEGKDTEEVIEKTIQHQVDKHRVSLAFLRDNDKQREIRDRIIKVNGLPKTGETLTTDKDYIDKEEDKILDGI